MKFTKILIAIFLIALLVFTVSCEEKKEEIVEKADEVADDVVQKVADETSELVQKAAEGASDLAQNAIDSVAEAADDKIQETAEDIINKVPAWYELELTDLQTEEVYTIASLNDMPVLISIFSADCADCFARDSVISNLENVSKLSLALNSEDEDLFVAYMTGNEFDWQFSLASEELSLQLQEEFLDESLEGNLILICDNKDSSLLGTGFLSSEELDQLIASC